MKKVVGALLTIAACLCIPHAGFAGVLITVDENGNATGAIGQGFFSNDPGPGGLAPVLNYNLPLAGAQGDVGLLDAGITLVAIVRFNGNGTLIFYSSNMDGFDALSDTSTPPAAFYSNFISLTKNASGRDGTLYTPIPGQPGYDPIAQPTYDFITDGVVTIANVDAVGAAEPGTMALFAMALVFFALRTARSEAFASNVAGKYFSGRRPCA